MEYLALYRKYRPTELDEVVGQNEIKKILASSVVNGTISHAYLFSGPRGTGKTTMAKILAKMVNCESPVLGNACNKCNSCLNILNSNDVIEIDAASNNGVDEIRDLREKANLVPSSAKYKVYIIDEVHMLTTQAFNALLKTLEEPPKHVIFVLATTEYYKIPLTITSRCQKFQFNKIKKEDIVNRLKEISKLEKIKIDDEALAEIAKISDGGMRDSINFLDQIRSFKNGKITINDVFDVCGNVSIKDIASLFEMLLQGKAEEITAFFENLDETGKNYGKFFEDMIAFLKDVILFKKNVDYKYIKNNIDEVKKIADLYEINIIFELIDSVNNLMSKLSSVSRQSVIVIANFLMMMNKINNLNKNLVDINLQKNDGIEESKLDVNLTESKMTEDEKSTEKAEDDLDTVEVIKSVIPIYNVKNKEIIINNTFAVASKAIKVDLQKKYECISDYLTDKKFTSVASTLIDTVIEVAGDKYLILSAKSDMIVDKVYNEYKLCNEFLNELFDSKYNFVVINNDEWSKYRDQYIENTRSGIKYELKELIDDNNEEKKFVSKEPTIVDKLFDLVGEDNVEFK